MGTAQDGHPGCQGVVRAVQTGPRRASRPEPPATGWLWEARQASRTVQATVRSERTDWRLTHRTAWCIVVTTTKGRTVKRTAAILTGTIAALALTVSLGSTAEAATKRHPITKADKKAAKVANGETCDALTGYAETGCRFGVFQWKRGSKRALTVHEASASTGTLVLYHGSRKVGKPAAEISDVDKRALNTANGTCKDVPRDTSAWEACSVGVFSLNAQRVITDADYEVVQNRDGLYVLALLHGSRKIKA